MLLLLVPDTGAEFLLLLATGSMTAVMNGYLSNTLGEAGLRKLARTVDAAGGKGRGRGRKRAGQ